MTTFQKEGNTRKLGITFYSDAAKTTEADPTTVVFKVTIPAGTTTTYTYGVDGEVVKSATGVYYFNLSLTTEGQYLYSWRGTGTVVFAEDGTVIADALIPE